MRRKQVQRWLAILLSAAMLVGTAPTSVLANETEPAVGIAAQAAETKTKAIKTQTKAVQAKTQKSVTAYAEEKTEGDFSYTELEDGTICITKYTGSDENVTIPAKIAGKPVSQIGESAFSGKLLKSITFEEGSEVTSIGNYAFYGCSNLTSISLPSTVEHIEDFAFNSCSSLSSISLPSTVESIGNFAFANCETLSSISLPSGLKSIGESAFNNCSKLASIEIPKSLSEVGDRWLAGSNIQTVSFGSGIETLADNLLKGCNKLISITIPSSVTSIGNNAFEECSGLEEVLFDKESSLKRIGDSAFKNCRALNSIHLPSGLESMGKEVFVACNSLTAIQIPKSLTTAGTACFQNSGIKTVTFDSEIETIADNLFSDCASLTSITIPDSVTSIGERAFASCSSLKTVTFEPDAKLQSIGQRAFVGCSSLKTICIPKSLTTAGDACFFESGITTVTFESGIETIADNLFEECRSLTSITIPKSVTSIGESAFASCSSLKTVTFEPDAKLQSIGESAFASCSSLEEIYIPKSLTTAGGRCFYNSGITQVTFESGIETIADNLFSNCASLTSITIPNSITSIGERAFYNCSKLETVTFEPDAKLQSIGENAFYYCSNLSSINLPSGLKSIGKNAFFYCSSLSSINLPSGLKSIGENAFSYCSSLKEIHIPKSLTEVGGTCFSNTGITTVTFECGLETIEEYLFDACSSLTSVTIPYTVKTIESGAFNSCFNLKSIILPSTVKSIADDAFVWSGLKTIYGRKGSAAEAYVGKNIDYTFEEYKKEAEEVNLTETSLTLRTNQTHILAYSVQPASFVDDMVWSSSNEKVAKVDADGQIQTIGAGIAEITLTIGEKSASCQVTVPQDVENITLSAEEVRLSMRDTAVLTATVEPENASNKQLVWESENPEIATVDANGNITPKGYGWTTITASSTDGTMISQGCRVGILYTVSYELNGGKNHEENRKLYPQNEKDAWKLTLQAPTKEGYTFDGWYVESTFEHEVTELSEDNCTVYAKWTANDYTVAYNGNGATEGSMENSSMTYDASKQLSANGFTRTGYTFTGWNTNKDGSGTAYKDKEEVKNLTAVNGETITLYGQWKVNSYTVVYNGNGSTDGSMDNGSFTLTYGASKKLSANGFTKTGYSFAGWNTKADGSGTAYANEAEVKNLTAEDGATITLYAQWAKTVTEPEVVKVSSIQITTKSPQVAAGGKVTLKAVVGPENADNKALKWTSSNKNYATVSSKGVVTTNKKAGGKTVTITAAATDGSGVKATVKVKIVKNKVTKVTIKGNKTVKAGKKLTLKATVKGTGNYSKTLKWTSSNKKYATVSSKGVVKANKKAGGKTVTITAAATDGSGKKASVKIKIVKNEVTKVTIKGNKTVKAGKKLTLKATVKGTGNYSKTLKWTSSNKKYATVSSKGVVKALKAGKGKTVTITAAATDGSNKKATFKIKIK